MGAAVRVVGHGPRVGDPAYACLIVRLVAPAGRAALLELLDALVPLVPDREALYADVGETVEEGSVLLAVPWQPPEPAGVAAQRQVVEAAAARHGLEAAWFFQATTRLPPPADEDEDDHEDEDDVGAGAPGTDDDDDDGAGAPATDDTGAAGAERLAAPASAGGRGAAGDDVVRARPGGDEAPDEPDRDDEAVWSDGPPPLAYAAPFPVEHYPEIIDELEDGELGVAVKLAGPWRPGLAGVLQALLRVWLAPYAGWFADADVTIDRTHHAAHLWVEGLAAPTSDAQQVRHLLWCVRELAEIVPVLHARFAPASAAVKDGARGGGEGPPFVLGGNPLRAVHAAGGLPAVAPWLAAHPAWAPAEVAEMLRELAVELVGEARAAQRREAARAARGPARLTAHAGLVLAARASQGLLSEAAREALPGLAAAWRQGPGAGAPGVGEAPSGLRAGGGADHGPDAGGAPPDGPPEPPDDENAN